MVVISGVATGTLGSGGAAQLVVGACSAGAIPGVVVPSAITHSVDVCPVVMSGVVGEGTGSGCALPTPLNATPRPPIAMAALAPIPADTNLIFIGFTVTAPFQSFTVTAPFRLFSRHTAGQRHTIRTLGGPT